MSALTQEAQVMQNPALGAVLLWRFAKAHADAHPQKQSPVLPVSFLILPLLWHAATAEPLTGTQTSSGLRKYAAKFTHPTGGARDVLLSLQDRATRWRAKTLDSLRVAFAAGLLDLGEDGRIVAQASIPEPKQNRTVAQMVDGAEKIGVWFASLTVEEVSLILQVRF